MFDVSAGLHVQHTLEYQEMFHRGKWVRAEIKPVLFNAYKYFKGTIGKGGISISALRRTVEVTGLSQTTIIQIVSDKRWLQENEDFPIPTKHYLSSQ